MAFFSTGYAISSFVVFLLFGSINALQTTFTYQSHSDDAPLHHNAAASRTLCFVVYLFVRLLFRKNHLICIISDYRLQVSKLVKSTRAINAISFQSKIKINKNKSNVGFAFSCTWFTSCGDNEILIQSTLVETCFFRLFVLLLCFVDLTISKQSQLGNMVIDSQVNA